MEDDCIVDDLETAEFRCSSELDIIKELETPSEEAIAEGFPTSRKDNRGCFYRNTSQYLD